MKCFFLKIHEKSEECLVCCNCADFVLKIEQFSEKCKNTNNMFEELLSKRIKRPRLIQNLRLKYNLDSIIDDNIKEEEEEEYIDCCKYRALTFILLITEKLTSSELR